MRDEALSIGEDTVPRLPQGVSKERVETVLRKIDRASPDIIDAVFALLDDSHPSWFSSAPRGARFCDGASTAHVGCHVGILQRRAGKLDREGRDYWLKPLWEIDAVEKVYLDPKRKIFVPGHPIAKSANCGYRLAPGFLQVLKAREEELDQTLIAWADKDATRQRLQLQAARAESSQRDIVSAHGALIEDVQHIYAPRFLPGYQLVYIDHGDGDRITAEDRRRLQEAGIDLRLGDPSPDLIFWNPVIDRLWIVEAVTSDGEVDAHKMAQCAALAERCGKSGIGFTTAYPTWKVAAARQGTHKNIPARTSIWISEDPGRVFHVG